MAETTHENDVDTPRERYPSGWLALTRHHSIARIVDALLEYPPHREFNQTELAEAADVTRQSVNRHVDFLLDLGIVEPVEGTRPQRLRFDPESEVSRAIIDLERAMNAAGPNG